MLGDITMTLYNKLKQGLTEAIEYKETQMSEIALMVYLDRNGDIQIEVVVDKHGKLKYFRDEMAAEKYVKREYGHPYKFYGLAGDPRTYTPYLDRELVEESEKIKQTKDLNKKLKKMNVLATK